MKKHLLTAIAGFMLSASAFSQINHRVCGTLQHDEYLKQTRKNYEQERDAYNKQIEAYLNDKAQGKLMAMPIVTVPVVVHVVYANATESISPTQAASQVQVLNDDFAKLNSDAGLVTQPTFSTVAAGANIRFCLAQRDPNGNPTTGIVYKSTTVGTFGTNDAVKKTAQGGDDQWDVTKYVNIWICDLGTSLLGYGEFPTTSLSNTWGLVINYRYTGSGGSAQAPFNLGRTGTHEFGHCFNLFHIWGDDGSACTGSDQCADTPNQASENYNCYPAGSIQTDGCATSSPGYMWMNYMDYTEDACMYMFTQNQVARMEAVVNTSPWNILQSSNGCQPVVLNNLDASILNVISPVNGSSSCTNSVTASVTLKNMGQTTLTSADINYQMDGGTVQTYSWTGSLASLATTNINLNSYTGLSASAHTFSVWVSNPNAGTDGNSSNDSGSASFTVATVSSGLTLPFTEGFENATFPPTGWLLQKTNTIDAAYSWTRLANTTGLVAGSTAIAKMDNYAGNNDITGQKDALRTPALDFSAANSTLKLKFDVSHRRYSTTDIDTLNVYISTDCGGSWTRLYTKGGTQLASVAGTQTSAYTPTAAAQWRRDSVSLSTYSGLNSIYLKFESRSGWGNNLYLDNININYQTTTGLNNLQAELPIVDLFPNPTSGVINLTVANVNYATTTVVNVINAIGQNVIEPVSIKTAGSQHSIDLSHLPNGVYYLSVKTNENKSVTKKIVISK